MYKAITNQEAQQMMVGTRYLEVMMDYFKMLPEDFPEGYTFIQTDDDRMKLVCTTERGEVVVMRFMNLNRDSKPSTLKLMRIGWEKTKWEKRVQWIVIVLILMIVIFNLIIATII